ncbi:MAG: hypothetical protein M3Z04_09630, partial [Chloroflexota bacterium]|nr:hypothetical protein [Chloroflexota bacterium]
VAVAASFSRPGSAPGGLRPATVTRPQSPPPGPAPIVAITAGHGRGAEPPSYNCHPLMPNSAFTRNS